MMRLYKGTVHGAGRSTLERRVARISMMQAWHHCIYPQIYTTHPALGPATLAVLQPRDRVIPADKSAPPYELPERMAS